MRITKVRDTKKILFTSLFTIIAAAAVGTNLLAGVPAAAVFIYIGGSLTYLLLVSLQKSGKRDRIDVVHTGEMALLALFLIPFMLHIKSWPLLMLLLFPAALGLSWTFRHIIDPFSPGILRAGVSINAGALFLILIMIFRWDIPSDMIVTILTGPLLGADISMSGFIFLYLVIVITATALAAFFSHFRLAAQGKRFYTCMRDDYTAVSFLSHALEAVLLTMTLMSIGILGSAVHWLIENRDDPENIIITFLLLVTFLQILLSISMFQMTPVVVVFSLLLSYLFHEFHRRRLYLW